MSKFISKLLAVCLLVTTFFSFENTIHAKEKVNTDEEFTSSIYLSEEAIKNYKEKGKNKVKTKNYKKTEFDDIISFAEMEIELADDEKVKAARERAEKNGNEFSLVGIEVNTKYINSEGEILTKERLKELKEENKKVKVLDSSEIGLGEQPSLKDIKKWEKDQESKQENEAEFQTNGLTYVKSASNYFTYMNAYIYVYEETSGSQQRNYFRGSTTWDIYNNPGSVRYSSSDIYTNDVIALAWNRGPTSSGAYKDIQLKYKGRTYPTGEWATKTLYDARDHYGSGGSSSNSAAFVFATSEVFGANSDRYAIVNAHIYTYSGYYTPSKFGQDGTVTLQYGERVSGYSAAGFSVSTSGGLSFVFSSQTALDEGSVWSTVPR